jgi:outer membrane biosynthesis protein TonB
LLGLLLLLGGGGLWFYTTRMAKPKTIAVETVPVDPAPQTPPPAAPAPSPEAPPPSVAPQEQAPPPPSPASKPEDVPPNPDFAKKAPKPAPVPVEPAVRPRVPAAPAPPAPVAEKPTSGSLHAAVEVAQYGEVVFEGLPNERLRLIFDHDAWQPTIHRQANGTQTLVMRSLKQGIQRSCDVKWEIVK